MYLLKRLLVLLSLCMCLWAANDYCEVRQATSKAFIVSGETQYLPLDSYVAGFDLAFTFENAP